MPEGSIKYRKTGQQFNNFKISAKMKNGRRTFSAEFKAK